MNWFKAPKLVREQAEEIRKLRSENAALKKWIQARHSPSVRTPRFDPKVLLRNGAHLVLFVMCGATASGQAILRTFYTTNTTPVVTASIAAMDTVTSNGLVTFTLTASNGVRLVAGMDATNHANAVLQSATNYANGVTNSSIVRQLELTAASNALINFTMTASNDVRLVAGLDATNHANAILQSATNYANGTTNSSIVRQADLTAASNALVTFTLTASNSVRLVAGLDATNHANAVLQSATNYANGVTNSSIVRQADLTTASNVLNSAIVAATNSASVTNWINSRQPASANLTNWSNIPTGAMANVVSTDFLTNWANAISNLTQTKTALTTNANQFGSSVQLTIKDGALFTNVTLHGTATLIDPQTNASSVNIAGGVTNWVQEEVKGTFFASSNALVKSGQSTSNAWMGGTYWWSTAGWTNHTATANATNLATNTIAGHVLTNNGDTIHIQWRIKQANAVANTNQFQIVYGSETVLDTGLLPSSNSVCTADLWITRTGNTSQHAEGRFEWGPGSGAPYAFTNTNVELVQTNGIATIFQLRLQARRVGAATNNWTRVWYDPAVR